MINHKFFPERKYSVITNLTHILSCNNDTSEITKKISSGLEVKNSYHTTFFINIHQSIKHIRNYKSHKKMYIQINSVVRRRF